MTRQFAGMAAQTVHTLAGGPDAPTSEAHAGYLSGKEPSEGGCFKAATTDRRRAVFYHILFGQRDYFLSTGESKSFKGTGVFKITV